MNINERFQQAIDDLYESNHYLAAEITKLGYPAVVDNIPTAGVLWDKERKKICFSFNENFSKTLNDDEFRFVVAHEALHFVNMHIFFFRDKVDEMQRRKKSMSEIRNTMNKLNVAADCVVNDSLVNLYKFKKNKTLGGKPIYYGIDTVKTDTHDMTVMDVFSILPEENAKNCDGDHAWESFFNEDGSFNKDFIDSIENVISNGSENSALSDEELSKIDDMKEQMEKSSDSYAAKAGTEAGSELRAIDGLGHNTLNWNKILFHFTENRKIEDKWTRPNRKLSSIYPEVVLPSYEHQEKEEIFVAIDVSGSIDRKACSLFIEVVKNSPKRFIINAISFDTRCHKYDARSGNRPIGGGGTRFDIIEKYIQSNFKKYPKFVCVFSDGVGSYIKPQYPKRWCWFLYLPYSTTYIGNMKWFKVGDLLK